MNLHMPLQVEWLGERLAAAFICAVMQDFADHYVSSLTLTLSVTLKLDSGNMKFSHLWTSGHQRSGTWEMQWLKVLHAILEVLAIIAQKKVRVPSPVNVTYNSPYMPRICPFCWGPFFQLQQSSQTSCGQDTVCEDIFFSLGLLGSF